MVVSVVQADVEDTLKRIETHKGVIGTVVVNGDGKTHTHRDNLKRESGRSRVVSPHSAV